MSIHSISHANFSSPEGLKCSACQMSDGDPLIRISHKVGQVFHWFHQKCLNLSDRRCPDCRQEIQAVHILEYSANEEEGREDLPLLIQEDGIEMIPMDDNGEVDNPIEGLQIIDLEDLVEINHDPINHEEGREVVGREEVDRQAACVAKICVPFGLFVITALMYFLLKTIGEANFDALPRNETHTWYWR